MDQVRQRQLIRVSRLMSLILRHQPERFGVALDAEGFTSLTELFNALRAEIPQTTEEDIQAVVAELEPEKTRFTIDHGDIRANYGHSVPKRIEHPNACPPARLFHGTSLDAFAAIERHGLLPMQRQYVHLTPMIALARRIGARHGPPQVLEILAGEAFAAGVRFYRANENFWLADVVPPQYLRCATDEN